MSLSKVQVQEIIEEKLLFAFHRILPNYEIIPETMKIRYFEHYTGEMVLALQAWIFDGHKTDVRIEYDEIETPATPWQFFKKMYAPKWFILRCPVKTETHRFRVSVHHHFVCPHIGVKDALLHHVWMGTMSGQLPVSIGLGEELKG